MQSKLNQIEIVLLKPCSLLSYCSVHIPEDLCFWFGTSYTNVWNSVLFAEEGQGIWFVTWAVSGSADIDIVSSFSNKRKFRENVEKLASLT